MFSVWHDTFYNTCAADGDPHFMIELPERDDALCFNINDKPGTILNLVRDPKSGQPGAFFIIIIILFCRKSVKRQQTQTCHYFQALWWMAKSLARRRWFLMGKLTLTLAVLVSSTASSGWGWRWALRGSQSSMTASRSTCCGLTQFLSKKPSE